MNQSTTGGANGNGDGSNQPTWGLSIPGRPPTPSEGRAQHYTRYGNIGQQMVRSWTNGTTMQFGPNDLILDVNPTDDAFINQFAQVDTAIRNARAAVPSVLGNIMPLGGIGGSSSAITGHQAGYQEIVMPHTQRGAAGVQNPFGNFRMNGSANPSSTQQVTIDSGTFPLVPSINASVVNLVSVYSVPNRGDDAGLQHPGYSQDSRYGVQVSPDGAPQMPTTRNPLVQQDRLQLATSSVPAADGRALLLPQAPTGPRGHGTNALPRRVLPPAPQPSRNQAYTGNNNHSRGATLPGISQPQNLGRDLNSNQNQGYRAPHGGRGGFGRGYGGTQQGSAQIHSGPGGYGRGLSGQRHLPTSQAGTGGYRNGGEPSMHDPRPQHIQEAGVRRVNGRRGGRGKDGKTADSEYAKYLDELNEESRRNGDPLLMGDRFSGHAYLQRQVRPSEDVGFEFDPPTPVMAPVMAPVAAPPLPTNSGLLATSSGPFALNMVPSAPFVGSSLAVPRANSTPPSLVPFGFGNLVFGQEAGTVTSNLPSPRKTSRFFSTTEDEDEEEEEKKG